MNILKKGLIFVIALFMGINASARPLSSVKSEVSEYLKSMDEWFNSKEMVEETTRYGIISDYHTSIDDNVLTVTYRYNSLVDFNMMNEDEKTNFANQTINLVKSVLKPKEIDYHNKGLVIIKFVWIDKTGRVYTAKF